MPNKRLISSKKLKSPSLPPFLIVFIAALFFLTAPPASGVEKKAARAAEVLTGDSVRLEGGKILKYAGIQSPPLQHLLPLVRQYGEEARGFNQKLVEKRRILVEWGPQIRDDQNRLLGYVFLEDGVFVNAEILKAGHARLALIPPNIRYAGVLRQAELEARRARRGLWKEEPQNPYIQSEYVGEKNTKIFYFPTSPELERIPQAQLVTFRSRVDAVAAGYRPCTACREHNPGDY